jgi:hypothetical protein
MLLLTIYVNRRIKLNTKKAQPIETELETTEAKESKDRAKLEKLVPDADIAALLGKEKKVETTK